MTRNIIISLFFLVTFQLSALNYYYDSFNGANTTCSTADNWCLNFPYGRHGFFVVDDGGFAATSYQTISFDSSGNIYGSALSDSSVLFLQGVANDDDLAYNNYWVGRTARFDTTYSATANAPFGFQVIRYFAVIDPTDYDSGGSAVYHQAAVNVWLIEDNTVSQANPPFTASGTAPNDFDTIGNYVYFFEKMNRGANPYWGIYAGTESLANITTPAAPDKTTANLNPNNTGVVFVNNAPWETNLGGTCTNNANLSYDDQSETGGWYCGVGSNRKIGIRMTHDGTTVRVYMNPNPESDVGSYAGYSNTWYLVGQKNVPFSTNMKVMLGQEQLYFYGERTDAVYDHFLVRPTAQTLTAQVTPDKIVAGSAASFTATLKPTITANDAGIGEVYIKKPSSFGDWTFNTITVCQDPNNSNSGSACNGAGEIAMTAQNASASAALPTTNPNSNQFAAYTLEAADNTGDTLVIRFRKSSSADNQVFNSTNAGANIRVYFTLTNPTPNATGDAFAVYADNQKFPNTAQEVRLDAVNGLAYSTTEKMQAGEATSGDLTVKTYSQPAANMAVTVSPSPLYWGDLLPFATVELRTDPGNSPDITQLTIQLPPEGDTNPFDFALDDGSNDLALIDSLKIPSSQEGMSNYQTYAAADNSSCSATFCYNTTLRQIVVNYGTTYRVPGANGFDRITFFLKKAPEFTAATQITTNWSATVDSTGFITGTTPQAVTAYQSNAANLQTVIRATPPVTVGWVDTNILSNNVNTNNPTSGTINYAIKNQGNAANIVKRVEILVPYETYDCSANALDDTYGGTVPTGETDCNGSEAGTGVTRENFATVASGDLTNFKIDGSAVTPDSVTVVGNETIGSQNYRVIRVDLSTRKIASNETLTFDLALNYYRHTNESPKTIAIKHRSDNENYSSAPAYPYPQYTDGGENPSASWEITLTPPDPRGEAFVYRGSESTTARIFTNEITTGNITDVAMKIINTGGVGNNIDDIIVYVPDYLTIGDVSSSYLGFNVAGSGGNIVIDNVAHTVTVNYAGASNPFKSNQEAGNPVEVLTFTINQDASLSDPSAADDVCTVTDSDANGIYETASCNTNDSDATQRTGTFYAKLNNASGTTSYTAEKTGKSFSSTLEFPDPIAESFVDTSLTGSYEVDATAASTTVFFYVKNTATLAGNNIYRVDIQFPTGTTIVSGTPTVSSIERDNNGTKTTLTLTTDYTVGWETNGTQVLTITYTDSAVLSPSLAKNDGNSIVDKIQVDFTDTVTSDSVQNFILTAFNKVGTTATGNSVTTTVFDGTDTDDSYNDAGSEDNALLYKIPLPLGSASIEPKVSYTTTGTRTMQSKIFVENTAPGSSTNVISAVEIVLPAGVSVAAAADVTARGGAGSGVTCNGGDGFTGGCQGTNSETIRIDYSGFATANLDPSNDPTDEILLTWSHSEGAVTTKAFGVNFYNSPVNGYSNQEAVPASLLTVEILPEPTMKVEVLERPGDPSNPKSKVNNQTITSTVPASAYHRFFITVNTNYSTAVSRVHQLKITPPSVFDVSSLDKVDLLPNGTDITASGSDLIVTFPSGQLSTANTTLEFRLQESRSFNVPGTNANAEDLTWSIQADYYSDLWTNATYSDTSLPGPSFTGKLTADSNDDAIVYVPGTDYANPSSMSPVSGAGDASKAWNITVIQNPAPNMTLYVTNHDTSKNEVFKINPGDPDYTYSQAIYVRNQGETDNDIRIVEATPPAGYLTALAGGDLTSVTVKKGSSSAAESTWSTLTISTDACATNDYTIIDTTSGTTSYSLGNVIRLKLCESARLLPNESLVFYMNASHNKQTTGTYTWNLTAGNYNETVALAAGNDPASLGQSKDMVVSTPTYTANFISDVNTIVATANQTSFTFTLTNESTAGDKLSRVRIAFPGYFDVSTAVVSSTVGTVNAGAANDSNTDYDTTGLSSPVILADEVGTFNKDNYLIIDYCADYLNCTGSEGLAVGSSDTITVTISDSFFDSTSLTMTARDDADGKIARPDSAKVTVKASAVYDTSGGAYSYITSFPTGSNRITITQPAPNAIAYLDTAFMTMEDELTQLTTTPRSHTFSMSIENTGNPTSGNDVDNVIYRAKIKIPQKIEGLDIMNTFTFTSSVKGATVNPIEDPGNDFYVDVDYEAVGGLKPGEKDTLTFSMEESVGSNGGSLDVAVWVDNHGAADSAGVSDNTKWVCLNNTNPAGCNVITDTARGTQINEGSDPAKTLRLTFTAPDDPDEAYVKYYVDPDVIDVSSPADLTTLNTYGKDAKYAVYLLGDKAQITYFVNNGSKNYILEQLRLDLSQVNVSPGPGLRWGSGLTLSSIVSQKLGTVSFTASDVDLHQDDGTLDTSGGANETKRVTIDYTSLTGGGLAVGASDTITITLTYDKPTLDAALNEDPTNYTSSYATDGALGSSGSWTYDASANIHLRVNAYTKHASVGVFKPTQNNSNPIHMYLRKARFGRISMQVAPKDAKLTFSLYESDGTTPVNLFEVLDGSSNPVPVPSLVNKAVSGQTYGSVIFDRLPPSSTGYVIKATASSPFVSEDKLVRFSETKTKTVSYFVVTKNVVTDLTSSTELNGPYQAKYATLDRDATSEQIVYAPTDSRTWIKLPPGALDNSPRINIRIEPTASQVYGTLNDVNDQIARYGGHGVQSTSTHPVYNLVNELPETGQLTPVVENQLKEEATLQLGYDDTLLSANGWDENSLSVYYWEYTRKQWVPVGGQLDAGNNTIIVKISYMHRTYTVMPGEGGSGSIRNVTVFPKVFTPGRTDSYYVNDPNSAGNSKVFGNMKLTFSLDSSLSGKTYEVAIYSISGKKIRDWSRVSDYAQGGVYWDGRDSNGNLVSGGIYIYVIRAGGDKYRGTVVVAR